MDTLNDLPLRQLDPEIQAVLDSELERQQQHAGNDCLGKLRSASGA